MVFTAFESGMYHFRMRKSRTNFHIKVRKPHFKLQKALFKKGLEKIKTKNVLELDDEKYVELSFEETKIFKKRLPF